MTISRLSYTTGPPPSKGAYTADAGLDEKLLDRIESLFEVGDADESSESLSSSRLPDGSVLISCAVGRTARALYLDEGVTQLGGLLPVDLWRSQLWERWDEAPRSTPMPGRRLPFAELVLEARWIEQTASGRLQRFLADVRALFAPEPGRQIVVIAERPEDVVRFIRVACASLPAELAARLTFTTRCADPRTATQQIVGTLGEPITPFTEAEARYQYRVHNLTSGVESPPADVPDPWAHALAAKWLGGTMTPEDAAQLWPPLPPDAAKPPRQLPHQAPANKPTPGYAKQPAPPPPAPPSPPEPSGRLAPWRPPPDRAVDPKPLFDALRSTAQNAMSVIAQYANAAIGRIPSDVARHLGPRLRDDAEFATACAGPLAAMQDGGLLAAALRDLDELARSKPRTVLAAPGFQALAGGPLRDRAPEDCGHLRVLIAAARTGPAGTAPSTGARGILDLLRAARVDSDHGAGSALATALALFWPPPTVIPAEAAAEVTAALGYQRPTLFDEDVLDRLVQAALMATTVDRSVIDLSQQLPTFGLRTSQEGALAVLDLADRFEDWFSVDRMRTLLTRIGRSLRDGDGVARSTAVREWWIDRTLTALFRPGPNEPWIDAVPELAACSDEMLLRRYRERVCAPNGQVAALAGDPDVLGRAVSAWKNTTEGGPYWPTTRAELLNWAGRLRGKSQNQSRRAADDPRTPRR